METKICEYHDESFVYYISRRLHIDVNYFNRKEKRRPRKLRMKRRGRREKKKKRVRQRTRTKTTTKTRQTTRSRANSLRPETRLVEIYQWCPPVVLVLNSEEDCQL